MYKSSMDRFASTPRQRRMMDRHDMDDFALLAALIIESKIGALVLGFLGKAVQRPGVLHSRYHDVPSGHMIAAELASLSG